MPTYPNIDVEINSGQSGTINTTVQSAGQNAVSIAASGNASGTIQLQIATGESDPFNVEAEMVNNPQVNTTVQPGSSVRMPVDSTLTLQGAAADAKTTGNRIRAIEATLPKKVNSPVASPNGQNGQFLRTNGDGTTEWVSIGVPTNEQVSETFMAWLDEHPEATTTVQDGSITYLKLNTLLQGIIDSTVNGAYVEDGSLYLTHDGEVVAGPFSGFGGGGGGGGGGGSSNSAIMSIENASGWAAKSVAQGTAVNIAVSWSSIEDGMETGNGTLTLKVNGIVREVRNVEQGVVGVEVSEYVNTGANTISISISDSYGNTRVKNFTVNVLELRIESSFDETQTQGGALTFPYTVYGEVRKTVMFFVDGVKVGQDITSESNKQKTYTIGSQQHGSHTIDVYFTATINSHVITSNTLHYDVMWVVPGNTNVIIASEFNTNQVDQYTTINIPYRVFDPSSQVANVTIKIDNTTVSTLTNVSRSAQTFSYRMDTTGSHTISIICGGTTRSFPITVNEVEIQVEAETENLALYLSSAGRNNNEINPAVWEYGTGNDRISATFSNFNWVSDGWRNDTDGITALRVAGNARVTIPYKIFESDFRTSGKTIEVEFATHDVKDYDSVIISCYSGNRGLKMTSQKAQMDSEQSSISMSYKEEEHVRISFVVEKRSEDRLMYIYVNGIMSGVVQYDDQEDFSQLTPVNITIGSNDCTTDIYAIRVYDNDLTATQIVNNWIADTQIMTDLIARFERNNIYDQYNRIVISKLQYDLPYFIMECAELPQYKGDKKTCSGEFHDPLHPEKNFTFTGAQIDVQGTSSQYYERKNYKIKFNNGLVDASGNTISKYKMRDSSIAVKTFCFKADVASSEGANNVELAILYNNACPYKTPAQVANNKVRQGIDGFPMVIFWRDTENDTTTFLGKYNFNNDKSTEEVFGFTEGDESWEVKNNTGNRVLWKSADYTGNAWLNDFEARYPDTDPPYEDPTQLAEFAAWVKSTDPEQATGDPLPESVTYPSVVVTNVAHTDDVTGAVSYESVTTTEDVTYTTDTAAYRKAKFRNELGNYVEIDSAIFYYLFTELFLMVDSRAKNMFPSFIGTSLVEEEEEEENE